ncbi:MAG: tetratricopeptide repeat protein [Desulfurella sp.]
MLIYYIGENNLFRLNSDCFENYNIILLNNSGFEIKDPIGRIANSSNIKKVLWRKPSLKHDLLIKQEKLSDYEEYIEKEFWYKNIFKFMDELKLHFGKLDFLYDSKDYYFLEVDPNGQWLWFDANKQSQICSIVANIIAKNSSSVELNENSKKTVIHAQVYYQENKLDKAIQQLNSVIESNPFNPNLHHDIALLYAQVQDYQKAISHMNIYLALLPNANDAQSVKDEMIKWEFKLKGD